MTRCEPLTPPLHGSVSTALAVYGVTVKVTCNSGYQFSPGVSSVSTSCIFGSWTESFTDCLGILFCCNSKIIIRIRPGFLTVHDYPGSHPQSGILTQEVKPDCYDSCFPFQRLRVQILSTCLECPHTRHSAYTTSVRSPTIVMTRGQGS